MTDRIAALGPFFAFEAHDPRLPPATPWRSMRELTDDPAVLAERVAAVRGYLAAAGGQPGHAVELRVAASVTHLGLVARILSPALALAVVEGDTRPLDLAELRWQPVPGGLFPLSLPRLPRLPRVPPTRRLPPLPPLPQEQPMAEGPEPSAWAAALVGGPLTELVRAAGALSVSRRVLWGNVASAVNGSAAAVIGASPAHAGRTRALAALLLTQPALQGTATGAAGVRGFRRRSCCLIYRAAPKADGPVCGDCVLTRRR
ncbi:(2Fe-2S)-binding protein [Streptacidiphilus carbonis]|uniref:(2Fe-2S)-binding protein n=1 Tax=Streptacidiphilus carbonis TaxID=105422 RepID=UPI0005A7800F|nr:(2Fe-2S)-binding protein [Streptacidiphilus carbonis]